jgi:hypothetical protein
VTSLFHGASDCLWRLQVLGRLSRSDAVTIEQELKGTQVMFVQAAQEVGQRHKSNVLDFSQIKKEGKWWTGKDSNLRTPQGRADLQSAGINHSPTCPKF